MTKSITVRLDDDNVKAVERVQKAHDEWLATNAPGFSLRDTWTVTDVVNVALREFCDQAAIDFEKDTKISKAKGPILWSNRLFN